jgi:hypothetical protein
MTPQSVRQQLRALEVLDRASELVLEYPSMGVQQRRRHLRSYRRSLQRTGVAGYLMTWIESHLREMLGP